MIRVGSMSLSQWGFSIVLISAGLLLLVAVASYYSYVALARSNLDSLNYTIEKPIAGDVARRGRSRASLEFPEAGR